MTSWFLCGSLLAILISTSSCKTISADLDVTYFNTTSISDEIDVFEYNIAMRQAARVQVESLNATQDYPILVVVRQQKATIAWQIPLVLSSNILYNSVARTLCPWNLTEQNADLMLSLQPDERVDDGGFSQIEADDDDEGNDGMELREPWNSRLVTFDGVADTFSVGIEFSSYSPLPVSYSLRTTLVTDFLLKTDTPYTFSVSPSTPQYFRFHFPHGVDSVIVYVSSSDDLCMVISIQPVTCPVFDLERNVEFRGMFQTISTSGALTVQKKYFTGLEAAHGIKLLSKHRNSFHLVTAVTSTDYTCTSSGAGQSSDAVNELSYPMLESSMTKNVTVTIKKTIGDKKYVVATVSVFFIFLGICIIMTVLWVIFDCCEKYIPCCMMSPADVEGPNRDPVAAPETETPNDSSSEAEPDLSGPSPGEVPSMPMESFGTKKMVADFARKPHESRSKIYRPYFWNLVTISIFYGLPVIQLVITFQSGTLGSGNEDACYYNFRCAHPLGIITAFNNVYSNIGYVMLGIFFLIFVGYREWCHIKAMKKHPDFHARHGVPRHFGLFYAMGIALFMEGVLSGCYHVCPSDFNFQFDTAFMYIIGCLGVLKVYQMRHPDIFPHPHAAYFVTAIIILFAVIGLITGSTAWWGFFSAILIVILLLMADVSIVFYYKSEWKFDRNIREVIRTAREADDGRRGWLPLHPERLLFLGLINILILACIIFGLVKRPSGFLSFLLAIVIVILLLYCIYYTMSKICHHEKLRFRPIIYGFLAGVLWVLSLICFFSHVTSSEESPAKSRTLNRDCIFLEFYDTHDVWHFLSSISLLLSFMTLLTLDDDLVNTPRDKIAAF